MRFDCRKFQNISQEYLVYKIYFLWKNCKRCSFIVLKPHPGINDILKAVGLKTGMIKNKRLPQF